MNIESGALPFEAIVRQKSLKEYKKRKESRVQKEEEKGHYSQPGVKTMPILKQTSPVF